MSHQEGTTFDSLKFEERDGELRFTIPPRVHPFAALSLFIWCMAAILLIISIVGILIGVESAGIAGIALRFLFALVALLQIYTFIVVMFNDEIIIVSADVIARDWKHRHLAWSKWPELYERNKIHCMRIAPETDRVIGKRTMRAAANGAILFNFGDNEARFGKFLSRREATAILWLIGNRFPNYDIRSC